MIYERVNWLNKGETGAKPINKTNLNQMDKGIYDLQNIELIGVEKTAPTECTTGDKYFNTTDKKIYTATADNTWGETGETPLRGILYVIISSQTSYYYDGDTLISIGGGASGGTSIPVSATPPENPEDGALWVDTDDEGVIVEVDQEVSTSSKNAVSNMAITEYVDNIENKLKYYSLYENLSGATTTVTLSDDISNYNFIEIYFITNDSLQDRGSSKVYCAKQSTIKASLFYRKNVSGTAYEKNANITINGTTLIFDSNYQTYNGGNYQDEIFIKITKVIGYKEV